MVLELKSLEQVTLEQMWLETNGTRLMSVSKVSQEQMPL